MKNKTSALLVAALLIGSVHAIGTNAKPVENVYEHVGARVHFNGINKELDDEYVVLNYKDHLYYPLRFITEAVGAEVEWDSVHNLVDVDMPSSYFEPEEEPTEEVEKEIIYRDRPVYKALPRVEKIDDIYMEIKEVEIYGNAILVRLEIDSKSDKYPTIDYNHMYLEMENGDIHALVPKGGASGWDDLPSGEWETELISEEKFDKNLKLDVFKISIPVKYEDQSYDRGYYVKDFDFYIDMTK